MSKKQALLFELMKEDTQPQAEKGFWSQLFRKKGAATSEPSAGPPLVSGPVPAEEGKEAQGSLALEVPQGSAAFQPENAPTGIGDDKEDAGEMQLYLRVNTFSKVLGVTGILVIFFCGYILGYQFGWHAGQEKRSDQQLSQISSQAPDEGVLKLGSEERPSKKITPRTEEAVPLAGINPKDILKNEDKITRKNGVNYLIIHVSRDSSEIEHAMEFLATKGIETSMERVENKAKKSSLYVLVSVAGFNKQDAKEKQQSVAYKEQIKALGQQYRQVKGSKKIDFNLCYYHPWPITR